jgi:hypothetical protein
VVLVRTPRYNRAVMLALSRRTAVGQSRRVDAVFAISSLPQSTDIARPTRPVRFVRTEEALASVGARGRQSCCSDCAYPPRASDHRWRWHPPVPQSTPPSESYGTVPLRSARVVLAVTWPPLSAPTLRTSIVPSESSVPMPMINMAFIIRLDPERIIVAPKRIPRPQQLRR